MLLERALSGNTNFYEKIRNVLVKEADSSTFETQLLGLERDSSP